MAEANGSRANGLVFLRWFPVIYLPWLAWVSVTLIGMMTTSFTKADADSVIQRVRHVEREIDGRGGPNDPLMVQIRAIESKLDRLESKVDRIAFTVGVENP